MTAWVVLGIAFVALIFVGFGYPRVTFPRQPGMEGVETPEVAQAYDRISRWPQFRLMRHLTVRELRRFHPRGMVVDVGCGPGYLITVMARAFPHLHLIGVDIAAEMLEVASRHASVQGLSGQVEFREGDIKKLPFEDETIDFVVSTFSLHHWSDPGLALQEIGRVLRPEGQFLLFDLRRDGRRLFYWLFRFGQRFIVPVALRRINEPVGSALASYTPVELETLLSGTPFRHWNIRPGPIWMFVSGHKG